MTSWDWQPPTRIMVAATWCVMVSETASNHKPETDAAPMLTLTNPDPQSTLGPLKLLQVSISKTSCIQVALAGNHDHSENKGQVTTVADIFRTDK